MSDIGKKKKSWEKETITEKNGLNKIFMKNKKEQLKKNRIIILRNNNNNNHSSN